VTTQTKLARAAERLIKAAIAERAAEQACRNRPWDDRSAWLAYVSALQARRDAVDALVRLGARS
jgi:hypothetical protein